MLLHENVGALLRATENSMKIAGRWTKANCVEMEGFSGADAVVIPQFYVIPSIQWGNSREI